MSAPAQMTAYTLNGLKGWPNMHALDYVAEFDSTVFGLVTAALPGMVVSLNSSGKYILGVGTTNCMPLFLFSGSNDPDVTNAADDPATTKGVYIPIAPTGKAMALVGSGSYELTSTAFVDASYPPNTPLTASKTNPNAGLLKAGTIGTDMIVGIVSQGIVDNGYGYDALAFWTCPIFHV